MRTAGPILKQCVSDLTRLAEASSKCTPNLQDMIALTIKIAASPPIIIDYPMPTGE